MKILYDYQIFDMHQFGGISRYFVELISQFEKDNAIDWELPVIYSNNEYLKGMASFKKKLLPKPRLHDHYANFLWGLQFRGKGLLYNLKNKVFPLSSPSWQTEKNKAFSIKKIKEGAFDIFHPTYYDDYFLEFIGEKPYVLTVYDLIHQIFPEFLLYDRMDKNKEMLQRSERIFAISENTKHDLVTIFGIDEHKVTVTNLAGSINLDAAIVQLSFRDQLPQRFLLFIGNREGYKNFYFFVQAFAIIAEREKDLCIVCTGPLFTQTELYYFNKLGIKDRLYHFYVDDDKLLYLYQHAVAFIFPSQYEGFGLPVLEAFGCGCPVLVSNTSSLPEVGGEAVIYFEPKKISSLIRALNIILDKKETREGLIAKGYCQLKKFSWQKTATITKEIYSRILAERKGGGLMKTGPH